MAPLTTGNASDGGADAAAAVGPASAAAASAAPCESAQAATPVVIAVSHARRLVEVHVATEAPEPAEVAETTKVPGITEVPELLEAPQSAVEAAAGAPPIEILFTIGLVSSAKMNSLRP